MQTRRDLYQAHKLMMQRVSLALLSGEPDAPESPMRRLTVAAFSGAMVAVLITAVFGIIGLIRGGGTNGVEQPGTLIIEKETGTRYVWSARDKKLIPFVNYTSARLALQSDNVKTKTVSRRSLAKYVRGPLSGIMGVPDSLPDPDRPAKAPWSLCVRTATTNQGGTLPVVTLVGGRNIGGRPLSGNEAVVVEAVDQPWLIYNDQRMKLTQSGLTALGADRPVPVSGTWLNGIAPGPDFKAPEIDKRGSTGPGPDGRDPVGQVYKVPSPTDGTVHWYVQLADGPTLISESQANLLLSDSRSKGPLATAKQVNTAQLSSRLSQQKIKQLPDVMPKPTPYDPAQPLCAVFSGTDDLTMDSHLTIGGELPELTTAAVAATQITSSTGVIDQIWLPGSGTLAGQLSTPKQAPQSFFIITDQGMKFPIPKPDDVKKLGFDVSKAAPVPANLLGLIPQGPALDPPKALIPVPATGTSSSGGS